MKLKVDFIKRRLSLIYRLILFLFLSGLIFLCKAQENDPFLSSLYNKLHDSPLQQKFLTIKPMPAGVVYVQQPGEGEKEMRQHFKTMKKLGFNCLKQIMVCPGWTIQKVEEIALDEGLVPWWYGEGGWEPVTPGLLKKLSIPVTLSIDSIRNHPKMIEYQQSVMRERIRKTVDFLKTGRDSRFLSGRSVAYEPEVGAHGFELSEKGKELFREWVKKEYKTIEQLNFAWNQQHVGLQPGGENPFASWDDFDARLEQLGNNEYRHLRDILKFKVEHSLMSIKDRAEQLKAFDPNAVFRGGGELGLFLPQASMGVDLESIADLMTNYGSFYPSIHFAWHFHQNNFELVRPFYMQSSLANDFFKGGWAATWESTGGPQQFSGGKGGNGFTVDEGVLTQFLFSQIAAGFKGFGLWCWNPRSAGWEAGEYALLDRNGNLTPRAIKVGLIAKTMQKYRDELWEARKEPLVGVLYDWENEAMWAALSVSNRDSFKQEPISARIGVSRALINANVPFEYVTTRDLEKGLAPRYKIIYMPQNLFISEKLLSILDAYVRQGGRLIADMPSAWFDEYGKLLPTKTGSAFEKLFGTTINDYQYSGVNVKDSIGNLELKGFTINQTQTLTKVMASYNNGLPAVTEMTLGKGSAVLLGFQASKMCFRPGNILAEEMLLKYTLGNFEPSFRCEGSIAYRLASPAADHYFLINDGNAKSVSLSFADYKYKTISDALTGEKLNQKSVALDRNNGRWIRCEK